MPYYMFQARYTAAAIKVMVDDPQNRGTAAKLLIEAVGGKLHNMFFCFGSDDVVAIIEAPDDNAMVAASLAVGSSGAFSGGATTKLLTSKEALTAMSTAKKVVNYNAPTD